MAHDKDSGREEEREEQYSTENSPRARNRTVMLTPDVTDQVRARLAKEMDTPAPTRPGGSGRVAQPPQFTSTYVPAGNPTPVPPVHIPQPTPSYQAPVAAPQPVVRSAAPAGAGAVWSSLSPVVGFLVSFDRNKNGEIFELRSGRLIITNEPAASGNYIAVADPTVSPMHAIMRISATGEIQVLDQLSEHGTKIVRFGSAKEEELSGDKSSVEHGDLLKFGARTFHVCVLARGEQVEG